MSSQLQLAEKMPNLNNVMMGLNDDDAPMTTAIAEQPPAPPSIRDRMTYTRTALVLPDDITDEEWLEVGRLIAAAESGIQWWLGDWINKFKKEWGWGAIYQTALSLFPNYDDGSLANFASVSTNVEFSRRRENLSYSHHVLVAGYTDQKQVELLQYAIDHALSVRDFKAYLTGRKTELPTEAQTADRQWVLAKLTKLRAGAVQAIVKGDKVTTVFYEQMKADTDELMGRIKALVAD